MNADIIKAIEQALVLHVVYKGETRVVEPHTYGRHNGGKNGLCAWQVSGSSGEGFRLFLEAQIERLDLQDQGFEGPRDGYARGDRQFQTIYAEL